MAYLRTRSRSFQSQQRRIRSNRSVTVAAPVTHVPGRTLPPRGAATVMERVERFRPVPSRDHRVLRADLGIRARKNSERNFYDDFEVRPKSPSSPPSEVLFFDASLRPPRRSANCVMPLPNGVFEGAGLPSIRDFCTAS